MVQTAEKNIAATNGRWLGLELLATVAAFGTYFSMYGFRKPFVAASYNELVFGWHEKTLLVTFQVLGYMCAKFYGVRFIAGLRSEQRIPGILVCLTAAQCAWVAFALLPPPWHIVAVFANGFPLGLVFGMVIRFLEGRRHSEAMVAGLCASFIVADGATKSVGTWLLEQGISSRWMPALAGLMFVPPTFLCTGLLALVPPPNQSDIQRRSERVAMDQVTRAQFLVRHGPIIVVLVCTHLVVTMLRSMRADFAPEIWRGMGAEIDATLFTRSETSIAFLVLILHGLGIWIDDNRRAFQATVVVCLFGTLIVMGATAAFWTQITSAFPAMLAIGLGLYLPYVAMHTSLFERLVAWSGDRANIAFLLYLADSIGYLGYVVLMLGRDIYWAKQATAETTAQFFLSSCLVGGLLLTGLLSGLLLSGVKKHRSGAADPVPHSWER